MPVCAKVAGRAPFACTLLPQASGEIPLEACPDWAHANAGATGYYRTLLDAGRARRALASGALGGAERVALAGDVAALVTSGDMPAADVVSLLPLLAQDPEREVVRSGAELARRLEALVADDVRLRPPGAAAGPRPAPRRERGHPAPAPLPRVGGGPGRPRPWPGGGSTTHSAIDPAT